MQLSRMLLTAAPRIVMLNWSAELAARCTGMEASYQGLEELSLETHPFTTCRNLGVLNRIITRAQSRSEGDRHGQKAVVLSHSEHPAMVHVQTEGGNISKAAIQDNAVSKPLCEGFLVHRVICISLSLHEMQ